jgi:regulator of sigma E protease
MAFGYFLLLLGGLIFFHELGHFLVARACGVKVLVFSLGFGPRFTVYRSKKSGTEYCVSLLPLGGYVKMLGDDPEEPLPPEESAGSFSSQPLWKRAAIVAAGPVFNLILPVFIFFFLAFGKDVHPARIGLVMPDGPAAEAGIRPGDTIVRIGGEPVHYWWQLQEHISPAAGKPLDVVVERAGEEKTLVVTPQAYREVRYAELNAVDERGQIRVTQFYLRPVVFTAEGSPAFAAGVRPWDRVLSVDGKPVQAWYEVEHMLLAARGKRVKLELLRLGEEGPTDTGFRFAGPANAAAVELEVPAQTEAPAAELGLEPSEMVVRRVDESTPAAALGLLPGDRLETLNGEALATWSYLDRKLDQEPERAHQLTWRRGNQVQSGTFTPVLTMEKGELNTDVKVVVFGAHNLSEYGAPEAIPNEHVWTYAIREAFVQTGDKIMLNVLAVKGLFTGNVPLNDLGGPILIGQLAAKTEEYGWVYFFNIMVMLSINLGLLNLLPIPVLDGGHLFLFAIEGLRRKPLSARWRQALSYAGLAFIVLLLVVVFKNDIERSWGDIVGAFR